MVKIKRNSRFILTILLLFWGYRLAKPYYPFGIEWYITIISTAIYGLIAITVHRYIQDILAIHAGDISQKIQKQNFSHFFRSFDILGFFCFPIFGFGWGHSTTSPKALTGNDVWQRVKIIGSGILTNLMLAFLAQLLIYPAETFSLFVAGQLALFAKINLFYALLSIFPIPSLDGWLLYKAIRKQRVRIEQESFYGEIILTIAMITSILPWIITIIAQSIVYWL